MTTSRYGDYLAAVRTLADGADGLATDLARAQQLGEDELDSASRSERRVEQDARAVDQRLRAADADLTRLVREMRYELEAVQPSQRPPATLTDADRLLAELQRELTAIDRNCDWVRSNRSGRTASTVAQPVLAPTPTISQPAQALAPAAPIARKSAVTSPLVWIVVMLAVLVALVLFLIFR